MEKLTLEKVKTLVKEKETQLVLDKIREKIREKKEKETKENIEVSRSIEKKNYSPEENSNILVSVILPTYNRGEKCVTAIKDVLNQTHKNLELIIINDGSTPEHTAIIENFINSLNDKIIDNKIKDSRIRYIKHPNMGMSASLNVGLKNISGEYVTWISDDNRLEKNYIEELLLPRADFSYSNYNIISNDHKYLMENKHNGVKDLINNFRGMASFLWKREIIRKIGNFNVSFSNSVNDYDFEIRTFLITQNIVHINKALIDFYQGIGTQSTNNHFEIRKKHKMVKDFYNVYLDKLMNKPHEILITEKDSDEFFKKFGEDITKINIIGNADDITYKGGILFIPKKYRELVDNLLSHPITENIKKTITELYREDIFSETEKKNIHERMAYKKIRYMDFPMNIGYLKFYQSKMQNYLNCIKQFHHINSESMNMDALLFNKECFERDFNHVKNALISDTESLYILDELSYPHMLSIYNMNEESKKFIRNFLENNNYIVYFSELFENENMGTIGNGMSNIEFSLCFFKNSKLSILCNTNNINILKKYNIKNVIYFPPLGYSEINGIKPLIPKEIKNVDILFMGSVGKGVFEHRNRYINMLENFSKENNYNFECYDFSLFGEEKNKKLIDTKIVIHIPSFSDLQTFPWAKTAELMAKKIFFIIESNSEMYNRGLSNIVAFYDPKIPNDFLNKIKYFLENEEERQKYIEKCFRYIRYNCDMDKFIENLL